MFDRILHVPLIPERINLGDVQEQHSVGVYKNSIGAFGTQSNVYDGALLRKKLTALTIFWKKAPS